MNDARSQIIEAMAEAMPASLIDRGALGARPFAEIDPVLQDHYRSHAKVALDAALASGLLVEREKLEQVGWFCEDDGAGWTFTLLPGTSGQGQIAMYRIQKDQK